MSIFKRAFLYVTRKRGKTLLLFAILLIMATFVLTGLSIWKASEAAQLDLRQSLGGKFDIFVDWSNSPYVCQRQFEIVRKRRRNFVVFRRQGGGATKSSVSLVK